MSDEERLQILEMIERGTITAEQGINLLNALSGRTGGELPARSSTELPIAMQQEPDVHAETTPEPLPVFESVPEDAPVDKPTSDRPAGFSPGAKRWRNWWLIPLWVGVGITVISALLMFLAYQSSGFGFWFACTWFPFLLGVLVLALAASSRTARWLHVRVTQKPGETPQRIAISMPLPLRLGGWFFKTFRHRIPGLEEVPNVDEMLRALEHASPDQPFYVEVDEGDDGERVEVYIG
ncbi:MAG: hypothetical protein JW726_16680 [Anaerolineales bacterium]|nr:hypothetical protein [Anaerolineales bacterium]